MSVGNETDDKLNGRGGAGQAGGGPYPGPHGGKKGGKDGFFGSGGQTEKAYHGHGRLGDQDVGDNANAPGENEGD